MSELPPKTESLREVESLRARVAELEEAAARRAQAESVLRESEQLYRSLVETSPDGIVVADLEGRILMCNRQTVALHGYDDISQVLGKNILDLVAPEDGEQASRDIRKILKSGSARDHQILLRRRDGSTLRSELNGSLIRDAQGQPKYILYSGRDITDRIRIQREFAEAQKLESIGRLAGGIAHDFNNLLAVILGNASLQLRNQMLPKKTIESLQDIVQAAERASSLTTQLLAYARGGLRRATPTDVNRVVSAAWELLSRTAPRQIGMSMELTEGLPMVVVDQSQIQQVVVNLCLNAIQASQPPSQIRIQTACAELDTAAAEEAELPPGRYVQIRVKDQGCGMDPAMADRIFDPFFTTKPDARGMGLPVAQGIVQSHGGKLTVASEAGKGTEVTVWIPVDVAKDAVQNGVPAVTNAPHGTETILIVDADATVSHTAEQILASLGYCVVTRPDEDQALAFLASNSEDINLVLLNPNTPKRTASQMFEQVAASCPGKPVLLMSGSDMSEETQALLSRGAAGFLPKPFSLMSLALAVREVLDKAAARPVPHEPA